MPGPRAVLGSQHDRRDRRLPIDLTVRSVSWLLRAEDGSRSDSGAANLWGRRIAAAQRTFFGPRFIPLLYPKRGLLTIVNRGSKGSRLKMIHARRADSFWAGARR